MAGIIEFKGGDWGVSSGGFRAMGAGVMKHLHGNDAALAVKKSLQLAIASELYYLDVAGGFTADMIRDFETALKRHVGEMKSCDAESWDNPELYPGYIERLVELQERLAVS